MYKVPRAEITICPGHFFKHDNRKFAERAFYCLELILYEKIGKESTMFGENIKLIRANKCNLRKLMQTKMEKYG